MKKLPTQKRSSTSRTAKAFVWSAVLVAAAVIALGSNLACSNPSTPAGHEGYVYEDPRLLGNGGFSGRGRGSRELRRVAVGATAF